MLAHHPDIERKRLEIQASLDSLKSAKERNRLGQFATPPTLAQDILKYSYSLREDERGKVRFLDPALGTGSFFSALRHVFPAEIIQSATGVEIDSAFAQVARRLWESTGLQVIEADFARLYPPNIESQKANLLVCNPPYVRHHHLNQEQKTFLKSECAARTGVALNGLAGLYCYFMLLCDTWLAADALSVWLIPSEFMDVNYGAGLKRYLCSNVMLRRIHRFDPADVQFDDALVSSAVVVFEKGKPSVDHVAEFTLGGSLLEPKRRQRIAVSQIKDDPKWTTISSSSCDVSDENVRKIKEAGEPMLSSLFAVKRGIATGANEFFILEREEASGLGLPRQFLKPILPSPRYLMSDTIDSDDEGFPLVEPKLVLLDCNLPEMIVQRNHPSLWAYLEKGIQNELPKRYLLNARNPWYSQEQRSPAPFLSTYMGRGESDNRLFRFFLNRSKAIAANVYLILYPSPSLASLLRAEPELANTILAFLNSLQPDDVKVEGRVYGGGLHKIEPKELGRLSITGLIENAPEISRCVSFQQPLLDFMSSR